jgi:hypothetical protein
LEENTVNLLKHLLPQSYGEAVAILALIAVTIAGQMAL